MPAPCSWTYNYTDLMRATGLTKDAIHHHKARGKFDPDRLETVVIYLARHAADHLRQRIIDAAILRDRETAVGVIPPVKRRKKTSP
jgi:hypothetical protein